MNIIDQKIKKLEEFQDNQNQIVLDSVRNFERLILDMNQDQLEQFGIDSDGKTIKPRYTPFTVSIKKRKGQPTDRVTLLDTGEFYEEFFVVYGSDYFAIGSYNEKAAALRLKYGDDIFGLIDNHVQELIKTIHPDILQELKDRT